MSALVWGVTKILPLIQEQTAGFDLPLSLFAEAYHQIRQACPKGDLRIHLSVEGSAEEVGVPPETDAEWEARQ